MEFQTRSLVQQGYSNLTEVQIRSLRWGLRFTPTVCMLASIYGLLSHNGYLLLVLAAVGIIPFWFPAWHPFDVLYNNTIVPLLRATRLPPNPLPRRVACVSGGALNIIAGTFLLQGWFVAAYVTGCVLVLLQIIVNTTHFCLASFLIELGLRLIGRTLPAAHVDSETARQFINGGGVLLDVRDRSEFDMGALPGARNIPLDELAEHAAELRGLAVPIVVYCQGGHRAQMAQGLLAQHGVCGLHCLGSMKNW